MSFAPTVSANTYFSTVGRRIWPALIATDASGIQAVLRLTLAAVMFPHGLQKAFGWFGGYGMDATLQYFSAALGLPLAIGLLVIAIELLGPIALAAGFLSRVAALGIAIVMVGAVVTTHLQHGFFMNWGGTTSGEGFEYHLLVLGLTAAVMLGGSGALSVDRRMLVQTRTIV